MAMTTTMTFHSCHLFNELTVLFVPYHGYHVLWLPPYHPELNPLEEGWGVTKGHVFFNNDSSNFKKVKELILQGFEKAQPLWPKLVYRAE
jgi:transposase